MDLNNKPYHNVAVTKSHCLLCRAHVCFNLLSMDTINKTWIFLLIDIAITPNDSVQKSFKYSPI